MPDGLPDTAKPEPPVGGDDKMLLTVLQDYFAFARSLHEASRKLAGHVGLSPSQYMILIAIARRPPGRPAGISRIAGRLHLSGAFVTIEVNKLVAQGLVDKRDHPSDGRRVQLFATDAGIGCLTRLAAFQRPINDALFGMLSREELQALARLLARLAAEVSQPDGNRSLLNGRVLD